MNKAAVEAYTGAATTAEVLAAMSEAVRSVPMMLPPDLMQAIEAPIVDSGTGVALSPVLRVVRGHKGGRVAIMGDPARLADYVDSNSLLQATAWRPILTVGEGVARVHPEGGVVVVQRVPTVDANGTVDPATWPSTLSQLITLYAAAIVEMQRGLASPIAQVGSLPLPVSAPVLAVYDPVLGTWDASLVLSVGELPEEIAPPSITLFALPAAPTLGTISLPTVPAVFAEKVATGGTVAAGVAETLGTWVQETSVPAFTPPTVTSYLPVPPTIAALGAATTIPAWVNYTAVAPSMSAPAAFAPPASDPVFTEISAEYGLALAAPSFTGITLSIPNPTALTGEPAPPVLETGLEAGVGLTPPAIAWTGVEALHASFDSYANLEDVEMAQTYLARLREAIESDVAKNNTALTLYRTNVERFASKTRQYEGVVSAWAQGLQARAGDWANRAQTEIAAYRAKVEQVLGDWQTKLQTHSLKGELAQATVRARIEIWVNNVRKALELYSANIQKEVQEFATKVQLYGTQVQAHVAEQQHKLSVAQAQVEQEVTRMRSTNEALLGKYAQDVQYFLGRYSQALDEAKTDYDRTLQVYRARIEVYVQQQRAEIERRLGQARINTDADSATKQLALQAQQALIEQEGLRIRSAIESYGAQVQAVVAKYQAEVIQGALVVWQSNLQASLEAHRGKIEQEIALFNTRVQNRIGQYSADVEAKITAYRAKVERELGKAQVEIALQQAKVQSVSEKNMAEVQAFMAKVQAYQADVQGAVAMSQQGIERSAMARNRYFENAQALMSRFTMALGQPSAPAQ